MRRISLVIVFGLVAASVMALPAAAEPIIVPGPGVCDGRNITLQDGEVLEERTLHLRGSAPVGPVDGWQDVLQGGHRLYLSSQAPTSATPKVYPVRPTGVLGNPNAHGNPLHGYWWYGLPSGPERMVCAELAVEGVTTDGALGMQIWIDGDLASSSAPDASVVASATPLAQASYQGNFGKINLTPTSHFIVQLDAGPPGAVVTYDSTATVSRFDYVVVVNG